MAADHGMSTGTESGRLQPGPEGLCILLGEEYSVKKE
jgi:hypothetical protein